MHSAAVAVMLSFIVALSHAQGTGELRVAGPGKQLFEEILDRSVRDANNDVCAGLVVLSDIDRLSFDANNGVVRLFHSPGRDLLFLQADERVVTILKSGYKPLRVILNEAGIRLAAGEVWQISVTGDRTRERVPVRIVVRPEGTRLFIDDSACTAGQQQDLSVGSHLVRIEKEGFETVDTTIAVDPTTSLVRFRLKPLELQPVWIASTPRGAEIAINDSSMGVTDRDVLLYPGRYRLRIVSSGFDTLAREIVVLAGMRNEYAFTLGKNTGGLVVRISPDGATLFVDGVEHPADARIELDAGQHRLSVEKAGYHPQGDLVEIVAGMTIEKRVVLSSREGMLQFSVQPSGANVVMKQSGDVYRSWIGDKVLDLLPPGDYMLEVSAQGYVATTRSVRIEGGEKTNVDVTMISEGFPAAETEPGSDEENDLPTAIGASLQVASVINDYGMLGDGAGYQVWLDIAVSSNWAITFSGFGQKLDGLYNSSYGGALELSGWTVGVSTRLFHIGPFGMSVQGKIGYAHGKTTDEVAPLTPAQPYFGDSLLLLPSVEAALNLSGFIVKAQAGQIQLRNGEWWKCTEYQVGIGFIL